MVGRTRINGLTVHAMQDEVIGGLLLRFVAVDEHEDILLREAVIANTEFLTAPQ